MSTLADEAAHEALRARQGAGARYDAPAAPHDDLLLARRGTAYFARKLNELSDADLDGASLRKGWRRRHVIAHVSIHARTLALQVAAVRCDQAPPPTPSGAARDREIEFAATLPARALRSLFQHSQIHLNVEWRDLTDGGWAASVMALDTAPVTLSDTPLLRAVAVWRCAVDLDNGARLTDAPERVAERF